MQLITSLRAHHLIALLVIAIFSSCSTDIVVDEIDEEVENVKTPSVLSVVNVSLEDLNAELLKNNIETFTESELEIYRNYRDEKACINAQFKGDVNGNDELSTEDVIILFQSIKEYDDVKKYPATANGDGKLNIVKEYLGESPDFWTMVHVAKLISTNESGKSLSVLERADISVMVDLLIGECL